MTPVPRLPIAYIEEFNEGRCIPNDPDLQEINEAIGNDFATAPATRVTPTMWTASVWISMSVTCSTLATIVVTSNYGSYECSCDDGYFLKPDGYSCEEQLGYTPCQDNASCDEDSLSCQCDTGFELEGEDCININECESDTDNCAPNANCEDTLGSFTCECNAGYEGDGIECTDIDECVLETDDCGDNATCQYRWCF